MPTRPRPTTPPHDLSPLDTLTFECDGCGAHFSTRSPGAVLTFLGKLGAVEHHCPTCAARQDEHESIGAVPERLPAYLTAPEEGPHDIRRVTRTAHGVAATLVTASGELYTTFALTSSVPEANHIVVAASVNADERREHITLYALRRSTGELTRMHLTGRGAFALVDALGAPVIARPRGR